MLSFQDTNINDTNNNRTYVLNLSRTIFQDIDNYRTPWEIVQRGFNYAAIDTDNILYMGQSFIASSTIYKELTTASTQKGIYGDAGTYIDTAENMKLSITSKSFLENVFTMSIIEDVRMLLRTKEVSSISINILDDASLQNTTTTNQDSAGQSLWDVMKWDEDNWSSEGYMLYDLKGAAGVFGFLWNCEFSQTADDIDMEIAEINIQVTTETGRN